MGIAKMPHYTDEWIKKNLIFMYNEILLSHKEE
jgi:hypothetical protein